MTIPFSVIGTMTRDWHHASSRREQTKWPQEIQAEINQQSKKAIELVTELLEVAGRFEQICRRDTVDGLRLRELLEECKGDRP